MLCGPNNKGCCVLHGTKMQKMMVTGTKWGDRGGVQGFGYNLYKVAKYHCRDRVDIRDHSKIT